MSIKEFNTLGKISLNKRSKFGNVRTAYNGSNFDSKKEAMYARTLDLAMHAVDPHDRVVSYETQVKYNFITNNVLICAYKLDFLVHYADGHIEYIDVKSTGTRKDKVYRIKNKMMKAYYGIDIKEVVN